MATKQLPHIILLTVLIIEGFSNRCTQATNTQQPTHVQYSFSKKGPDGIVFGMTQSNSGLYKLPIINNDRLINVLVTYWDKHTRLDEFRLAFMHNLRNPYLKRMYVFYEKFSGVKPDFLDDPKVEIIKINTIATHRDFYHFANTYLPGELVAIVNADIILDNTLELLKYIDFNQYIVALTRYNYKSNWPNNCGCMDTWIFRSPIRYLDGNYIFGIRGTEHIMIYEWLKCGYRVINPSLSITTWHVHMSNERSKKAIKGFPNCPDYRVKITTLEECLTQPNSELCTLKQYVRLTRPIDQIEHYIGRP